MPGHQLDSSYATGHLWKVYKHYTYNAAWTEFNYSPIRRDAILAWPVSFRICIKMWYFIICCCLYLLLSVGDRETFLPRLSCTRDWFTSAFTSLRFWYELGSQSSREKGRGVYAVDQVFKREFQSFLFCSSGTAIMHSEGFDTPRWHVRATCNEYLNWTII